MTTPTPDEDLSLSLRLRRPSSGRVDLPRRRRRTRHRRHSTLANPAACCFPKSTIRPPPSPRLDGLKGTRIATERLAEAGATVVSRASPEARHRLTRQTSTVKNAGKVVVACLDGEHHVVWGTDLAKVIGRDAKIVVLVKNAGVMMAIFERRLTWEG